MNSETKVKKILIGNKPSNFRKKMSIIVRLKNEIVVYCKGADSEIYDSLSPAFLQSAEGCLMWKNTKQQLEVFSSFGLRTLCLAKRILTPKEFDEWSVLHSEVSFSVSFSQCDAGR